MHMFTFGGLTLSLADYMKVGWFCSSRRGGKELVRVDRRGIRVPCWLVLLERLNRIDSPSVALGYEHLDHRVTS
jgi:hypothetical protein